MAKIPAKILRMYVRGATLADALPHLRETYCGTIAYEIEHITSHRQRVWLREKIESGEYRKPLTTDEQRALLQRLVEVDALERFMHKAYLGQKQFSIEGLDMTVPMLDEMIQLAAAHGAREVVVGMAHRGRLNVLAHNLGRPYETIFAEFEGASTLEAVTSLPQGGTGDVKYHHGAQGTYALPNGDSILVNLESNPSHLEYVHPVVLGASRAAQTGRQGPHARRDTNAAVPIILHGDAAFPGQGVVAESLNLQAIDGYKVGGALHLIQNNQLGFTTDPEDSRSTHWASDLAKGYDTPIIHVNADDVAACISAVRLGFAFRQEFGSDVVLDLIGYRRFGHNEADEPAYTQPEMYARIKSKKRVTRAVGREARRERRRQPGGGRGPAPAGLGPAHRPAPAAQGADQRGRGRGHRRPGHGRVPARPLALARGGHRRPGRAAARPQRRAAERARGLHRASQARQAARAPPRGAGLGGRHRLGSRRAARVRLAADRGRARAPDRPGRRARHVLPAPSRPARRQDRPHAVADPEPGRGPGRIRAAQLAAQRGRVPGFEYGYSQEAPETLVLWEAQFGDFVNSAQVVVDQFIVSGLAKWGQTSRLTLLLPHGYEGSGPEHSSARLERFLTLAAEGNLRVANLTTPAQYFHLIRRQAKVAKQRPLVIMTPKSLLRLPQATNRIEHLSETRFFPVLGEPRVPAEKVKRLILCTGKIFYDLIGHPSREGNEGVAVGRVELLYPFPESQLRELVDTYPNLTEVVWVQEEPRNMGARAHMSPRLMQILPHHLRFGYIGRPERASPGEGYPAAHTAEQNRILRTALDLNVPVSLYPAQMPGLR